jgi:hypothetical protein
MRLPPIFLLVMLAACAQKPHDAEHKNITAAIDSTAIGEVYEEKDYFVDRGRFENEDYILVAKSHFIVPDSLWEDSSFYYKGNFLYFTDKKKKTQDTIALTYPCGHGSEIMIKEVTKDLKLTTPLFRIATPECSDYYTTEFIEYNHDSLKDCFNIFDVGPADPTRKDEFTLTGTLKERDDLVYSFNDHVYTVSLASYLVTIHRPTTQAIKYSTVALENFTGNRISDSTITGRYLVKKGNPVIIDSINSETNMVRIIVKDSIVVQVPFSVIEGKVRGNSAG